MKPRVNRNTLKPLAGEFLFTGLTFFFFMIEKSSLIHRILITHGISHTTS